MEDAPLAIHTDVDQYYWYAVHTRSRHEFQVVTRLEATGMEVFLPTVERLRKWKDRKKFVTFPLFPGYLFVHVPEDHYAFIDVLKTPGVVRMLGARPGRFEPVPEEQIASLKRLVTQKELIDPYPYLKEGQRIVIKRGPLAGVEGILVKKASQHLLVVSIDLIRQGVSVKIDASDVETVN